MRTKFVTVLAVFLTVFLVGQVKADTPQLLSPSVATYKFNFEITSDQYAGTLSGPLFSRGTFGTGIAAFEYQPISAGQVISPGVNATYIGSPFNVDIQYGTESMRLIDSSQSDSIGRRGIIVSKSVGPTYDTILFEGSSGNVFIPNSLGIRKGLQLHTQVGLFSPSNGLSDYALSAQNFKTVSGQLIESSFNIQSSDGQVNGRTWDWQLVPASPVPEPETYAMLLVGLGLIGAAVKRRKAKQA